MSPPEPVLGSVPHAVVEDLEHPRLSDEDHHHLARALRVADGDPITVTDGRGRWRAVRFGATLRVTGPVRTVEVPVPQVTVAFSRTKGDRPEWTVQKLTELGVDRIVVFEAERSVARWDPDRRPRQLARLRRVAREAVMQSRRTRLPAVEALESFAAAAALPGACLADPGGGPPSLEHPTVLVGPEGGFSATERTAAGLPAVRLGDHVLRAETAAVTAGAVFTTLRAGIVVSGADPPRRSHERSEMHRE